MQCKQQKKEREEEEKAKCDAEENRNLLSFLQLN
jgi:hypothetical protein